MSAWYDSAILHFNLRNKSLINETKRYGD